MDILLPSNTVPSKLDKKMLAVYNASIETKQLFVHSDRIKYILQDGPPYANGEAHMGHLLNKCLKDFIVKRKLIEGFDVEFKMGWDCHGLPIELRSNKEGISCVDIANKYIESQYKSFTSFGIFSRGGIYKTMDTDYKDREKELFNVLLNKGIIKLGWKPVFYSPSLKTTLANSEIQYEDITEEGLLVTIGDYLIYTSTEWSLCGHQAVCLNPNIEYVKTIAGICSKSFADSEEIPYTVDEPTVFSTSKNVVLWSDKVLDEYTGVVHLVGGHGLLDFEILSDNNIEGENCVELCELEEHIKYSPHSTTYPVFERFEITHSCPVDNRTGNRVYYFGGEQYFMDINANSCKLNLLANTNISPKDRKKLLDTLYSRKEWCISRQRKWGVPIPSINILDVWFDSGSSFLMHNREADLYLEGIDQHRGWFQSSLILSTAVNRVCAKEIVSHCFIVDNLNNKLSKSLGNYEDVQTLYDKYSPDVIRLFFAMSNWRNADIMLSEEALINTYSLYLKLRTFMRYYVNNIYHLNVISHETFKLSEINSDLYEALNSIESVVKDTYDTYNFRDVVLDTLNFMQIYSSSLTEEIKNDFYEVKDLVKRYEREKEFLEILKTVSKILYPILPFLVVELETALGKTLVDFSSEKKDDETSTNTKI